MIIIVHMHQLIQVQKFIHIYMHVIRKHTRDCWVVAVVIMVLFCVYVIHFEDEAARIIKRRSWPTRGREMVGPENRFFFSYKAVLCPNN